MKEIISSVLTAANERVKSPFFGAYIFSWFAFNWKAIAFLLFGNPTYQNIVEKYQALNKWEFYGFPFIAAFVYLILGPYLNILFQWLRSRAVLLSKSIRFNEEIKIIESKKNKVEADEKINYSIELSRIESERIRKKMELEVQRDQIKIDQEKNNAMLKEELQDIELKQNALNEKLGMVEDREARIKTERNKVENETKLLNDQMLKFSSDRDYFNKEVSSNKELMLEITIKDKQISKLESRTKQTRRVVAELQKSIYDSHDDKKELKQFMLDNQKQFNFLTESFDVNSKAISNAQLTADFSNSVLFVPESVIEVRTNVKNKSTAKVVEALRASKKINEIIKYENISLDHSINRFQDKDLFANFLISPTTIKFSELKSIIKTINDIIGDRKYSLVQIIR